METTFLGLAVPVALQQLKKMLIGKGFRVQIMPTSNPVLLAYQEGSWLRKPKQLVLEISSVEKDITRIDITAIVNKKNSKHTEVIIEENFATAICNAFKKVIAKRYGN